MSHFDLKELSPENHERHMRRLRRLQRSVERHDYRVSLSKLAGDMIREAASFAEAQRFPE